MQDPPRTWPKTHEGGARARERGAGPTTNHASLAVARNGLRELRAQATMGCRRPGLTRVLPTAPT